MACISDFSDGAYLLVTSENVQLGTNRVLDMGFLYMIVGLYLLVKAKANYCIEITIFET